MSLDSGPNSLDSDPGFTPGLLCEQEHFTKSLCVNVFAGKMVKRIPTYLGNE